MIQTERNPKKSYVNGDLKTKVSYDENGKEFKEEYSYYDGELKTKFYYENGKLTSKMLLLYK